MGFVVHHFRAFTFSLSSVKSCNIATAGFLFFFIYNSRDPAGLFLSAGTVCLLQNMYWFYCGSFRQTYPWRELNTGFSLSAERTNSMHDAKVETKETEALKVFYVMLMRVLFKAKFFLGK